MSRNAGRPNIGGLDSPCAQSQERGGCSRGLDHADDAPLASRPKLLDELWENVVRRGSACTFAHERVQLLGVTVGNLSVGILCLASNNPLHLTSIKVVVGSGNHAF